MADMDHDDLSKCRKVGKYILKSKLGESSLSTLWKAEQEFSGDVVVVKQIYLNKLSKHLKSCLNCELNFLSSVRHPNIVRLFDVVEVRLHLPVLCARPVGWLIIYIQVAECCIYLVIEFCAGGNLASYIQQHGRVSEQTARKFMQQLAAGLEILHSHHIVHRDLKPENLLLSSLEDDVVLKIADFGLSSILHPGKYAEKVCGSPLYMAPEVLQFQKYDEKVDMWSVGAVLFELLNGYPPFCGRNNVQLLQNIKSCTQLPFSQPIIPKLHPDCIDMCIKLLSINPVDRLSFNEFYQHSFLKRKGVGKYMKF